MRQVRPSRPVSSRYFSLARLNLVLTPGIPSLSATASIHTDLRHRVIPEFIGSRKFVPIAFTAKSQEFAGTEPITVKKIV